MPSAEAPPPGFQQCILYLREGDPVCPTTFPDKVTFYDDADDTRMCTRCECTETQAPTCLARMSAYQGADCTNPLFENVPVSDTPMCVDAMQGMGLGSVQAHWDTDVPGTCMASGGLETGEIKPVGPSTFCCQPPP
jgi:hypothetical protein